MKKIEQNAKLLLSLIQELDPDCDMCSDSDHMSELVIELIRRIDDTTSIIDYVFTAYSDCIGHFIKDEIASGSYDNEVADRTHYIKDKHIIIWISDDIIDFGKDLGFEVSKDEAMKVIQLLRKWHDCNHGTSWTDIEDAIKGVKGE